MTLKEGMGILAVVVLILLAIILFILPVYIFYQFYTGAFGFEFAVVALLTLLCYMAGGSGSTE